MSYDINNIVASIGEMHFEGNIIPIEWFKHIKFDNEKPDTGAILILSDIVYWYRPTIIRNEETGSIVEYRKKFKSDLLQKSYQDYADLFGFSKRQVTEAIIRLESLGIVRRVFRTITTKMGRVPNVLFIELMPDILRKITFKGIHVPFKSEMSLNKTRHITHSNEEYTSPEGDTNTEITTEITTEKRETNIDNPEKL